MLTGELPSTGANAYANAPTDTVTGTFEVDIHQGAVGADNCGPIDKHGAFSTTEGSKINVDASGVIYGGIPSHRLHQHRRKRPRDPLRHLQHQLNHIGRRHSP